MTDRLPLFAVAAPGLEALCAAELRALGIAAAAEPGGAAWEGTMDDLYRANLWLRTASRVVVRAATFRARTFIELERHARKVPWERWVVPGRAVRLRVTSKKSKLYHEGAIAERLLGFIEDRVGGIGATSAVKGPEDEPDDGGDAQLFVVRVLRDEVTISADSSGALLHLRGYRQAVAKAPLRETLAAAMLLGAGWRGDSPLLDPMCGSGTIPIEAALLARNVAPGLASASRQPRAFAFTAWPGHDAALWERAVAGARDALLPAAPVPIAGSDRDAGAVDAARANAERAGVAGDVDFAVRPVSAMEPPARPGLLICNPPYGVRVGESDALRNLYAALGRTARARCPGWTVALLAAERKLEAQVGIPFTEAFRTSNGGIPVRLVVGRVEA
ncbi:MAG TPA: class I SAM-dependent RNA methyltransferase [Longimicrobium sp.]|jgi:putative N6-adenine-specific DNA methylase|nr:class I SAM-dependent RNA methyltransferase [Longimicrobium sp.]